MEVVVVGGGRMGEALVGGLLATASIPPEEIGVVEVSAARRDALAARFPDLQLSPVVELAAAASGAVVAVKPPDASGAVGSLASLERPPARVLSIAAGVRLAALEAASRGTFPVLRAMPNLAAVVGASATGLAASGREEDLSWAEGVLAALGTVTRVPEKLLDAVTALAGSGPAYLFLVAEAMVEGGVLAGLPREAASQLVRQTFLGSARLLVETGESPEGLRGAVTSPAGTTAAGLRVLEGRAVRAAFLDAIDAAAARAGELGGPVSHEPGRS